MAISLDAEKAFDRLERSYLFQVLSRFNFCTSFINWVETLYFKPQAKISCNSITSATFPLFGGSRQGCSLSPLLFVLATEPLSEAIRTDPNIKGIHVGQVMHTINLFADDICLFLLHPADLLSRHLTVLERYSSFFLGYKVNMEKSEVLPLNNFNYRELEQTSPF